MCSKLILTFCVSLFLLPFQANAADAYQPRLLRVSLVEGDVTYQRSDLDKWADLSVNTPILEGDKIWSGRDGRVEVEFEDGSTVRLAENTATEFSHLGSNSDSGSVQIQLIRGVASFAILSQPGPLAVETAMLTAVVQQPANFRVDADTDGSSRLVVFEGKAEVQCQAADLFLGRGETFRLLSSDPERYYLGTDYQRDEWDQWNSARDDYLARLGQEQGGEEVLPWNEGELNAYGSWFNVPTYGRVWRPHCDSEWAPFRAGRWTWYDPLGWTWISYEPWGWLPYHYGRWALVDGVGWCWVACGFNEPWCPGAVAWAMGPGWVGWCPLAPNEAWYPNGYAAGNVFVSSNFRHRKYVTYLPRDTFINGTTVADFRAPLDPTRGGGQFIPGQPDIPPTTLSRMPVVNKMGVRKYDNEDLAARWGQRNQIIQNSAGAASSTGGGTGLISVPAQVDQRRNQREQIAKQGSQVQSVGKSTASRSGVQVINGGGDSRQAVSSGDNVRTYGASSPGKDTVRTFQRNELDKYWNPHSTGGANEPRSERRPDQVQSPNTDPSPSREEVRQVYRIRSDDSGDRAIDSSSRGLSTRRPSDPLTGSNLHPTRIEPPTPRYESDHPPNLTAPSTGVSRVSTPGTSSSRESVSQAHSEGHSSGSSAQGSRSSSQSRGGR